MFILRCNGVNTVGHAQDRGQRQRCIRNRIATVNTQAPTPEHLPDHLRDHAQRITALTDFAHRCAYDTDHPETVLHAVVLTRPEDRAAMTALRDYLDLFAEDSTITVPFEDLTCVHAPARAGPALTKAFCTPPKP